MPFPQVMSLVTTEKFHDSHIYFPSGAFSEQLCTAGGGRECQVRLLEGSETPGWKEVKEVAVRFCGGQGLLKGCLVPKLKKTEGEEDTETFPLPHMFCLASLYPCSHLPPFHVTQKGAALGEKG